MHDTAGQTQIVKDRMDPARAAALHAAIDMTGDPPGVGDPLPGFFHQIYFWDPVPTGDLGDDGHKKLGGLIPDLGLPRRMWAGGRLRFHAPLLAGIVAEKISTLRGLTRKEGRSGRLAFVTVRHEIRQRGTLALSEDQDIVYREAADPNAPDPVPPQASDDEETVQAVRYSVPALFRYSALTMNAHRIHYDADYCRSDVGYPGLVVHGPLLAQGLISLAEKRLGRRLAEFSFRATAPLFQGEACDLCAKGNRLWARGPDARLCMTAEAR